jgi:hypothetical protein
VDTELTRLSRRYVWWLPEEPPRALLLCQLMQLGTYDDVRSARRLFGDDAFREALRNAPPGVIDARSWNFWHLFFGIQPVPPMPSRPLPWIPSNPS